MRKQIIPLSMVILLFFVHVLPATIVEHPLNCAGTYDIDTPVWETNFDLGFEFLEISHVYIDWDGDITGGQAVYYSDPDNPFPIDVGIYASLGSNPNLRRVTLWGGSNNYPNPESFDCVTEFELIGGSTWSDLLDGKGTITIGYTELILTNARYIESGNVDLNNTTLVFEGTEIPEPTSIFFLSLGISGLRIRFGKKTN